VSISMYSSHIAVSVATTVSRCVPTTLGRAGLLAPKFTISIWKLFLLHLERAAGVLRKRKPLTGVFAVAVHLCFPFYFLASLVTQPLKSELFSIFGSGPRRPTLPSVAGTQ